MAPPFLFSRVEQPNPPPGDWVVTVCLYAFGVVAQTASQPKILFVVGSAFGFRIDVLDLQYQRRVSLMRQTVAER
jgi:hypothetical protein